MDLSVKPVYVAKPPVISAVPGVGVGSMSPRRRRWTTRLESCETSGKTTARAKAVLDRDHQDWQLKEPSECELQNRR